MPSRIITTSVRHQRLTPPPHRPVPKESPNIQVLFSFALTNAAALVPPVSSQLERTFISTLLIVYLPLPRTHILLLNLKLSGQAVTMPHGEEC